MTQQKTGFSPLQMKTHFFIMILYQFWIEIHFKLIITGAIKRMFYKECFILNFWSPKIILDDGYRNNSNS
ncbi:hypothetical protein BGP_5601 [Beggiatoa sp. PS]|nr:hypothetical protein BGP_5601 [Beggiatoa sp. PS]